MSTEVARIEFGPEQIELIKRTICANTTDDELALFLQQCRRTGLDPFARQIHGVKRKAKDDEGNWVEKLSIQIGIDGFRLIALRSGEYGGQVGPFWCGPDGKWVDVWLDEKPPAAAKVGVVRKGFADPVWAVARYASYCQMRSVWQNRQKVGEEPNRMWATMPDLMLAKCAESLALRKAFPAELSGLYSSEEMNQPADAEPDRSEKPKAEIKQLPQPHTWTKAGFEAFLARKGKTWAQVLDGIDHARGTNYRALKTPFAGVAAEHIAAYAAWAESQDDAPAPEGEDRADPTSARTASAPTAAPSTASVNPAPATAATDLGPKPMPAAERRTAAPADSDPPRVGKDFNDLLVKLMTEAKVTWPEIRDRVPGKGREIADACKLALTLATRVIDLPASDGRALRAELEVRIAETKKRAAQRDANKARREMDAEEARRESGAPV